MCSHSSSSHFLQEDAKKKKKKVTVRLCMKFRSGSSLCCQPSLMSTKIAYSEISVFTHLLEYRGQNRRKNKYEDFPSIALNNKVDK